MARYTQSTATFALSLSNVPISAGPNGAYRKTAKNFSTQSANEEPLSREADSGIAPEHRRKESILAADRLVIQRVPYRHQLS
jgi:hypothetical protein